MHEHIDHDGKTPGPLWLSELPHLKRQAIVAADLETEPYSLRLGAFWPMEWRLAVQWADLFARIDMLDHEHPGFMIEEHWQLVRPDDLGIEE